MPCWETRTQEIDLNNVNADMLGEALSGLGFNVKRETGVVYRRGCRGRIAKRATLPVYATRGNVKVTFDGERVTLYGPRDTVNETTREIKRAYTPIAFKHAAKRAGFTVKKNTRGQWVAERKRYQYA